MPPLVFFVGLGIIVAVIAAYVILELARPWPNRQARKEKERHEKLKAKRHAIREELLKEAEQRDMNDQEELTFEPLDDTEQRDSDSAVDEEQEEAFDPFDEES